MHTACSSKWPLSETSVSLFPSHRKLCSIEWFSDLWSLAITRLFLSLTRMTGTSLVNGHAGGYCIVKKALTALLGNNATVSPRTLCSENSVFPASFSSPKVYQTFFYLYEFLRAWISTSYPMPNTHLSCQHYFLRPGMWEGGDRI